MGWTDDHTSCITADLAILITLAFTFSSTRARNAAFNMSRPEKPSTTIPKTHDHADEGHWDPEMHLYNSFYGQLFLN